MAVEFYIPKMSDHMEEAVFVEWLVTEGDAVEKGQPILVIDTDKVVAEVEAPASGLLTGIRPGLDDGVTIAVGVTVAFIVEDLTDEVPVLEPLDGGAPSTPQTETSQAASVTESQTPSPVALATGSAGGGPVRATPAGRKAARDLGVDLAGVQGTGPGGRISESDVRKHASTVVETPSDAESGAGEDGWLDLTLAQSVTARRMVESVATVPQFSVVAHLDVTDILAVREQLGRDGSLRPSVTAYLVKAVAGALVEHPRVNGFYREGRIRMNHDVNVGVAWGTSEGLFVPVIHGANRLSVAEIADRLTELRALADGRGFNPSDLDGGTFTLSNLGMFEIDEFRALINPPQSAILATGRVSKDVVVGADDAIRVRDRMSATLTADHRSLDGVAAALFLASISGFLQDSNPTVDGPG